MSLDEIEKILDDLEALKEYDRVKKESDELKVEVEVTKQDSELKQDNIAALEEKNRILKSKLAEEELSRKNMEAQSKAKEDELSKLKSRNLELESLQSITNGKTLAEIEKIMLEAEQEEIGKQAEERAKSKHSEWEKTMKPKEVAEEALKQLDQVVEGLLMPEHKFFPKGTMELGLPEKVSQLIELGVNRKIDDEFNRRVEVESEKRAQEKANYVLSIEWPKWKRENMEPKVAELDSMIKKAFSVY